MSELPPDRGRLQAILRHLEGQIADNDTIGLYLRLQRDAVRRALAAAEGGSGNGNVGAPGGQFSSGPAVASPGRRVLESPPSRPRQTGFVIDRQRTPHGAEPSSVHLNDCNMTSSLARGVSAEQARMAIAGGLEACVICRPDSELGILEG
jgi:hypothetical protein